MLIVSIIKVNHVYVYVTVCLCEGGGVESQQPISPMSHKMGTLHSRVVVQLRTNYMYAYICSVVSNSMGQLSGHMTDMPDSQCT